MQQGSGPPGQPPQPGQPMQPSVFSGFPPLTQTDPSSSARHIMQQLHATQRQQQVLHQQLMQLQQPQLLLPLNTSLPLPRE